MSQTGRDPPRSAPGLFPVPPATEMPNSNGRCSDLSMGAADYGRWMQHDGDVANYEL
jgi:hypothetical protein